MAEITIVNNRRAPTRINVVTGDAKTQVPSDCVTTIKLAPGANLLKDKAAEAMARAREVNRVVQRWFDDGTLETKNPPAENKSYKKGSYIKDLSDLKQLDAMQAIADCKSVKDLKRWAMQDPRPPIQKALTARYDVLTETETSKKANDAI